MKVTSYHAHFFIEDISQVWDVLEHRDIASYPATDTNSLVYFSHTTFQHSTDIVFCAHSRKPGQCQVFSTAFNVVVFFLNRSCWWLVFVTLDSDSQDTAGVHLARSTPLINSLGKEEKRAGCKPWLIKSSCGLLLWNIPLTCNLISIFYAILVVWHRR